MQCKNDTITADFAAAIIIIKFKKQRSQGYIWTKIADFTRMCMLSQPYYAATKVVQLFGIF